MLFEHIPIELWTATPVSGNLSVSVDDDLSISESVSLEIPVLEINVNDSLTVSDSVNGEISILELSVSDSLDVEDYADSEITGGILSISVYDGHRSQVVLV